MRKRNIRPALAVASVLVLGAGCSLGDGGPRPGVAAEVEGEVLTIEDVDEVVRDICEVYDEVGEGASPIPIADARARVVDGWVKAAAVEEILEERGLPAIAQPADEDVEAFWAQAGFTELSDGTLDSFGVMYEIQVALNDGQLAIGEDAIAEAGQTSGFDVIAWIWGRWTPTQEDLLEAGQTTVTAWLSDHDAELNPVFGEIEDGTIDLTGGTLSVPVSGPAELVLAANGLEATPEDVLALPADQRCGPDEVPAPAPPVPMG